MTKWTSLRWLGVVADSGTMRHDEAIDRSLLKKYKLEFRILKTRSLLKKIRL